MPPPSAELLAAWERAAPERPAARPLALLEAAGVADPAALPVGRRNARLLRLRERWLGPELAALDACPACAAEVEFAFTADDLLAAEEDGPPGELAEHVEGIDLHFRPPTAGDLAALGAAGPGAARELLARCLLAASRDGRPVAPDELPESALHRAAGRMAEADPDADLRLALACPACGATWSAPLDVAGFLWAELDHWARRLLDEVHALASAYGWAESAILTLTPARRRAYLDRIQG